MIACPRCGADTRVTSTGPSGPNTHRRRVCTSATCLGRVSSLEVALPDGVTLHGQEVVLVPREQFELIANALENVLEVPRARRRRGGVAP